MSKKILFISAHPDDVEVCAGGTIARHLKHGDSVDVACLFLAPGFNNPRLAELIDSTRLFTSSGKHFHQIGWHFSNKSERDILFTIEKTYGPESEFDRVYTVNSSDSHPEHQLANKIATAYCRSNLADLIMLQPAIPGGVANFNANMFVDISAEIEMKKRMIEAHKSQLDKYSKRFNWIDAIISRDRANGYLIGMEFAEAFNVLKLVNQDMVI